MIFLKRFVYDLMLILMVLTLMVGCAEKPEISTNEALSVSKELISAQQSFVQIYEQIQEIGGTQTELNSQGLSSSSLPSCLELQVDSDDIIFFPATYSFDYGDGCKSGDHKFSGKLSVD